MFLVYNVPYKHTHIDIVVVFLRINVFRWMCLCV